MELPGLLSFKTPLMPSYYLAAPIRCTGPLHMRDSTEPLFKDRVALDAR